MIRLAWDWIVFIVRGCTHPKREPTAVDHVDIPGHDRIFLYYSTCTVCGTTIVSTD